MKEVHVKCPLKEGVNLGLRASPHHIKALHVCFRQGLKCTQDELTASAYLTVLLDDSMGGSPLQVRGRSHTSYNDNPDSKAPAVTKKER